MYKNTLLENEMLKKKYDALKLRYDLLEKQIFESNTMNDDNFELNTMDENNREKEEKSLSGHKCKCYLKINKSCLLCRSKK